MVLFDDRDQAIGIRGSRRPLSSEASLAREAAVAHRRVSPVLATAAFDVALRPIVSLLGLDIGASLTGEGTETLQQLDALNTLAVEHAQGYAPARPTTDRQVWAHWAQRI